MVVSVNDVVIHNKEGKFTDALKFTIEVEATANLGNNKIDWKIVYVGSASDEKYDQCLKSFKLGPLKVGVTKFQLTVNPPDAKKIPVKDLLGSTVLLLIASYKEQEFIRIAYYISNTIPGMKSVPVKKTQQKLQQEKEEANGMEVEDLGMKNEDYADDVIEEACDVEYLVPNDLAPSDITRSIDKPIVNKKFIDWI